MPLYEYQCACGKRFDRFLPLARYNEPQTCECGQVAEKRLSAPSIAPDYPAYTCPITGKVVEGRRAHEENLKRHDCRILETGEREELQRRRKRQDEALENTIAESAAEFVEKLPSAKREQLGRELEYGLDVTIQRL